MPFIEDTKPIAKKKEIPPTDGFIADEEQGSGLIDKAKSIAVSVYHGVNESVLGDVGKTYKEGFKNVKELPTLTPEVRSNTFTEFGNELKKGGKGFALGIWDILDKQIPKAITTIATAYLDNTRLSFGIGLPNQNIIGYEPKVLKENREKAAKWTDDLSKVYTQASQDRMTELGINNDTSIVDPSNFAYKLASGAGSMGLSVGIAVVTKNPTMAAGFLGLLEGSDTYNTSRQKLAEQNPEMTKDEIDQRSLLNATIDTVGITALEKVGLDFLFRSYGKGVLYKASMSSITETVQETSQTVWSNLVSRFGYDKTQNIFEGVGETILLTMPIGFFSGGLIGRADVQIVGEEFPEELVEKVAKENNLTKAEAKEVMKAITSAIDKEVANTPNKIVADEAKGQVEADLKAGKSPTQVALELSQKVGVDEAKAIVAEVQSTIGKIQTPAGKEMSSVPTEAKKSGAVEDTQNAMADIISKTPEQIQEDFNASTNKAEVDTKAIQTKIDELKASIKGLKDGSVEKKNAKLDLSKEQANLKTAEENFNNTLNNQASDFRTYLGDYVSQNFTLDLTPAQNEYLINKIVERSTTPDTPHFKQPLSEVVAGVVSAMEKAVKTRTEQEAKGSKKLSDMTPEEITAERMELVNKSLTEALTKDEQKTLTSIIELEGKKGKQSLKVGDTVDTKGKSNMKGKVTVTKIEGRSVYFKDENGQEYAGFDKSTAEKLLKAGAWARVSKSQKEQVKEVVGKKGKASIKEIAKETGILEPNIRRILGVGAKDGEFERIADGVYRITIGDQELAVIIPADAREVLPQLVKDGFKADMVFLDIPYDTKAVKGGNRGAKYSLISVDDFSKVLDSVKDILKDENAPVIHFFSQAKSGLKEMEQYNSLFTEKGFVAVGKGDYTKTYKNGERVAFPTMSGSMVTEPEGILVFTQSGNLKKDIENLNFKLVRPKGYQTEKPAEMIKALIEMTTEEGDVVLDPFAGSGVVPAEAVKSGRKAVAIEKDKEVAENITKKRVEEALEGVSPLAVEFDKGFPSEMNKSELKKAGIDPEAMGFDEHASVLKIGGKPAVGFSFMEDGALGGLSVAKDFRKQGVETKFVNDQLDEGGGTLRVADPNESMLALLKKIGTVSEPDGSGTVTLTRVDKNVGKADNTSNDTNNNNSGGKNNGERVSTPISDSENKSEGAGGTAEITGDTKRGQTKPTQRGGKSGERLSTRLTNEEIEQLVSTVTHINKSNDPLTNGLVTITHEITEDILEAANQYKTGGEAKEGRGILDEYYTSSKIVDMVKSLFDFPAKSLKVLEPAVGTGNFIYALPEIGTHDITTHEINAVTARIAKIFHNNAKVYNKSFETTFIDERGNSLPFKNDYDLVIGNPPYGEHRGKYLGLGEETGISKYEDYFVRRGLDVLKEGGTLAMVLPSSFLDRKMSIKNAELVNAFRLPEGAFENTEVGTDIVILTKKLGNEAKVGGFFKNNPANVLGEVASRKNRFGKMEDYVKGDIENATSLFYEHKDTREAISLLKELNIEATQENVEEAENAIDEAGDKAKALVKEAQKEGKKTIEKKVVKKAVKEGEVVSLMSQFEGQFTDKELEVWKDTQSDGSLKNPEKHKDVANYMGGKYYNDFNYAQGDIYEKLHILAHDLGTKKISKTQYDKQEAKLEAVKPKRESIDDLKLSPNIGFVKDIKINMTDGRTSEELTLRSGFLKWLQELPREAFGGSSQYEVREYVNDEQVRGSDKDRNELERTRRKIAADNLFTKYLKEGLNDDQKEIIEEAYNKTFNFYHTPDYKKVPMFSNTFSTYKGKEFDLRDVQKHGIGRLVNTGVGILAHDVGFGKTISGVLAISETMHRGWASRPIIVVPSENVYQQWISTIEELVPDAKLNLLGNLGVSFKGDLSSLKIPEKSITLVTYEGFKRLGFNDGTYSTLASKFKYIADDLNAHKSTRDEEKAKTAFERVGGTMKKGTRADLFFEDLGFDHITFDEVHNANHIVGKVKLEKGQSSEFNRFSLRPSDLGIKTWLASQYIQQKMDGRNVNLLSATPFTNHPLEYYSILSLVADKSLSKMGLQNVNDFFGTFMEAESEYEFKADGTYQKKTDIRRFRNFRQFRKLLDTYIDFKEGEAEGIVRPDRVQKTYEIPQNQFGLDMEARAQSIFKENEKEAGQGAKVLRAITELRKIAFSPYASKFADDILPTQYKEFVENSPKIKTLMSLIGQNRKDRAEAGQIVYVDQVGVQFLPMMRDYLIKEMGYKVSEVEIISGATAKPKRTEIQNKYNKGEVKILLGSEAIKEGMNLQENSSDLYIMSLPWNFTQLRQVIGRAWRQGNRWANVRINNLFIQDSVDIFLSQKLDNKQKRYEAAIKSGEQEVDVGDVSFDEMKFDLIRDPATRAKLELQAEKERISQGISQQKAETAFATRKLEKINEIAEKIKSAEESRDYEEKKRVEAVAKGEEANSYWVDRYTDELAKLRKLQTEEMGKLKEKGIDTETLLRTRAEGEAKITELEAKEKELTDSFDARVAEIAASMPPRVPFSQAIVDAMVADRAEQNKDFYKLKSEASEEVIKAVVQKKEIKNSAGTKVVKTKTTTTVTRGVKAKTDTKDTAMLKVLTDSKLTVQEKVDTLLDKKQEGKKYKDAGERVAGSKKENAVIQAVIEHGNDEILRALANELGVEPLLAQLTKQKILENVPTPNRETEIKNKVPAWIAGYKIKVLNSIGRAPVIVEKRGRYNTTTFVEAEVVDTFIAKYPSMLKELVKDLNDIKDKEAVDSFMKKYRNVLGFIRTKGTPDEIEGIEAQIKHVTNPDSWRYIEDAKERQKEVDGYRDEIENGIKNNISINVLGKSIDNVIQGGGKWTKDTANVLRDIGNYEGVKNVLENGVQEENGFSDKKIRYVGLGNMGRTSWYPTKREAEKSITVYKKENPDALKETDASLAEFNTDYDRFLPEVEMGKAKQLSDAEKKLEQLKENISYLEKSIKDNPKNQDHWVKRLAENKKNITDTEAFIARLKGEESALTHGNFQALEEYDVKDSRFKKDFVNTDNLMRVYGFKSAQLGNYMDDVSAREHIVQTMAAMEDMSKILGVDFSTISNKMGLSVAFGARGGGSANAHFEPTHKIINLTKKRGDGSFGHEFMHALDYILGAGTYRGKWSGGTGYGKFRHSAVGDQESMILTRAFIRGVDIDTEKTFTPQDVEVENIDEIVVKWRKEGKTLEEAIERVPTVFSSGRHKEAYQDIANLYRKDVIAKVKTTSKEYYANSLKYGGGKDSSYWVRKEELWARAFQAYLEDKMTEAGIKNNYLTRTTKDIGVYPQGAERVEFNKLFDNLFRAVKEYYPVSVEGGVRFKKEGEVKPVYKMTEAENYLRDLKQRLNLDFDIHFVDNILAGYSINPFTKEKKRVEAYGASVDNTIALVKEMAEYTAEHETVHLTLANLDKIPVFRTNGITRDKILSAQAEQLGIAYTASSDSRLEEELAKNFEQFVAEKHEPKGLIRRFFILLKQAITRLARAIGIEANVIENYYDILAEGEAVDGEMVRLENKGIMEAYIEDGVLNVDKLEDAVLSARIKPMETNKADAIAEAIEKATTSEERMKILGEMTDVEALSFARTPEAQRVSEVMSQEEVDFWVVALDKEVTKFRLKEEGDKRMRDLKGTFNDLVDTTEKLAKSTEQWKLDMDKELAKQAEIAPVVADTSEKVKELSRFTNRKAPPVGTLTKAGEEMAETLEFANKEEAQEEISAYLKQKVELVETRNRLRTLRRQISQAKKDNKVSKATLRDVERKLKLRQHLLEAKDFNVNLGIGRGKKEQMKMIRRRGLVLNEMQDIIGLSDAKAKQLIGGIGRQKIHLMSEKGFNDFMVEFVNRGRDIVSALDAQDSVRAYIQEMQFQGEDNVRQSLSFPTIGKMSQQQASIFEDILSKYEMGDTFLSKRQLETIHRTNWGDVRTQREMQAKIFADTGITREDLKNIKIDRTFQKFKNWLVLSRSNPVFAWLVDRRFKAKIQSEAEKVMFEKEMNPLVRAARKSRAKTTGEKVAQALAPTDTVVFDYIESENKPKFIKDNGMTQEELTLAHFLIGRLFEPARQYMTTEYGMKDRQNYITHLRRGIIETFVSAVKAGRGVKAGVVEAVREILTSQREDEAVFKILGGKTGEVLAFEKWFKFAMPRTGGLVPTKNVAKASLAYASAYFNKLALDELIPEAIALAKVQEEIGGYTPKGLPDDPTVRTFIDQFLNDAKGRKIDFVSTQGDSLDNALRLGVAWTAFKYLGFRPILGLVNFIGEFVGTIQATTPKEAWNGIKRTLDLKKSHNINQAHEYFTGRNPLVELFDPQHGVTTKVKNAAMVLFSLASFFNNRFYLRAKMTEAEWQNEVVQDPRMVEIVKEMSKWRMTPFYGKSLVGGTAVASTFNQFASWAIPIVTTTISDLHQLLKNVNKRSAKESLTSEEIKSLGKTVLVMSSMYFIGMAIKAGVGDNDDDDRDIWFYITREMNSLLGAFGSVFNLESKAPLFRELLNLQVLFLQILKQEKYKQDGKGYSIGDWKAGTTAKKLVVPSFIKSLGGEKAVENTKERMIQEGIKSGNLDAEKIAEFTNADEWNNVKGERDEKAQEEYRAKKVGEIKALAHLREKYPNSVIGQIIVEEDKNKVRIDKMVEYAKEVGADVAYKEVVQLYKDRFLCSDTSKKTGCMISGALLKDFQRAKRNL